jgi:hypothetical protein
MNGSYFTHCLPSANTNSGNQFTATGPGMFSNTADALSFAAAGSTGYSSAQLSACLPATQGIGAGQAASPEDFASTIMNVGPSSDAARQSAVNIVLGPHTVVPDAQR